MIPVTSEIVTEPCLSKRTAVRMKHQLWPNFVFVVVVVLLFFKKYVCRMFV